MSETKDNIELNAELNPEELSQVSGGIRSDIRIEVESGVEIKSPFTDGTSVR